jgi:hypothetical protein
MPHQFKDSSVADTERHLSCKQVHVGAKPTGGSISNTLHIVTVSIPRCERGGAGANPAVGTNFIIVRKAKSRASGPQNRVTQCEPGAHVHFSSDTREPANSLGLGPRQARGSTGVSDHSQRVEQRAKSPNQRRSAPQTNLKTLRPPPFALRFLSLVAQQSEHQPLKRRVGGANPPEAASFMPA